MVKQTYDSLRPKPTFVKYEAHGAQVHGPKTVEYGWRWFEMGFFVHWEPSHTTTIFCFDIPESHQILLQQSLSSKQAKLNHADPYSIFSVLVFDILALYDASVWSMRNHVCKWEAVCRYQPQPRNNLLF